MTQVIVLNGGSSSGKSSIARALQDILPGVWLTFGTDTLAEALPGRGDDPRSGLVLEPDGTVIAKPEFRAIEEIWYQGLAVMASRGARLILDEVFLAGGAGQQRFRGLLGGLDVLWAGVHCDPLVAAGREVGRPDRVPGMAMSQALAVHEGAVYDVEVDTTGSPVLACAQEIARAVRVVLGPSYCTARCRTARRPRGSAADGEEQVYLPDRAGGRLNAFQDDRCDAGREPRVVLGLRGPDLGYLPAALDGAGRVRDEPGVIPDLVQDVRRQALVQLLGHSRHLCRDHDCH
jgi:chloramphenicol 3-O phosphotransferase